MRRWIVFVLALAALLATGCARPMSFNVVETGIPEMRQALSDGRLTSRQLVVEYLTRIALYEDQVKAIITVNPRVLEEADALDRERAQGKVRGPLHGIPIALKDNIHTTDMPTTGGAVAFEGYRPPYDATVTRTLRAGGAIIIAKTVLTELANWIAGVPTPMPANYSGLAGYGLNPYDPRRDPREGNDDGRAALVTGGSSSGIGTAASFWAANVGTETSGSILSPANQTMLVGIKPTVGRISRYGIIPLTADQDTAGPMARTVTDAAILLGALEDAARDPNDPGAKTCAPPPNRLHALPEARRAQGRAHRHPARLLLRRDHAAGRDGGARRAQRGSGPRHGRGGRGPQARRGGHRRSGGYSEHRRPRPGEQLPALAHLRGRPRTQGKRRQLLHRLQVRDEARL
jgi:Asp-tRNA(Asn)/Glu-tRNA(Gln) amidotransferase A subunit family amidase